MFATVPVIVPATALRSPAACPPRRGVEVILQQGWPRMPQAQVEISLQGRGGDGLQLLPRRHVLDDTGHVRESHPAEAERAVAAIIQDQPVLDVNRVEEIRAKPDHE